MKIKKTELLKALAQVKPGLAAKEAIEQSTSFVFINGFVATYNDEIAVSLPIDMELGGAVQSRELFALLNKIKDDEITVSIDDNEFRIQGKKFKSGIRLESEIVLPLDFLKAELEYFPIPVEFEDGVQVCLFSAAQENVSPVLSNIHVKSNYVESCDNFRLTRFKLPAAVEHEMTIPSTAARHLVGYSFNNYAIDDGWIHFRQEETGLVYSCRTFEETYPDLEQFLQVKGSAIKLPDELRDVLDRSGIFSAASDGTENLVQITVGDNWCVVRGENDNGWIEEKIRVKTKGATIAFQVSPKILQDILSRSNKATLSPKSLKFVSSKFTHVVSLINPEK